MNPAGTAHCPPGNRPEGGGRPGAYIGPALRLFASSLRSSLLLPVSGREALLVKRKYNQRPRWYLKTGIQLKLLLPFVGPGGEEREGSQETAGNCPSPSFPGGVFKYSGGNKETHVVELVYS